MDALGIVSHAVVTHILMVLGPILRANTFPLHKYPKHNEVRGKSHGPLPYLQQLIM